MKLYDTLYSFLPPPKKKEKKINYYKTEKNKKNSNFHKFWELLFSYEN